VLASRFHPLHRYNIDFQRVSLRISARYEFVL
jgi:hypothetical protein